MTAMASATPWIEGDEGGNTYSIAEKIYIMIECFFLTCVDDMGSFLWKSVIKLRVCNA